MTRCREHRPSGVFREVVAQPRALRPACSTTSAAESSNGIAHTLALMAIRRYDRLDMASKGRLLIIVALACIHSGCAERSSGTMSIAQTERSILAAAPTGWTLVSRSANAMP